jgi:outer membrane lipoprotein-sorting protein
MSIFTSRPVLRWAVPAAAAVAVVGAGVAAKTLAVAAEPNLPPRTAAQLLVDLQTAKLDGLSGTVVERADLGLPDLGALGNLIGRDGSSNLTSLVSGKHTLRVWYSGPDKARVALVGTNSESDVIRNGKDLWLWDSKANTATHHVLSTEDAKTELPNKAGDLTDLPKTPQEAADLALKAIDPTTVVTTGNTAKIAGRNAYELVLSPRDTASLVSQVRLAIDATEHLPLRVQILAKGSGQPAFEVGFTQVSFARPDNAQFQFTPPSGAKVTEPSDTPKADGKTDGRAPNKDLPKDAPSNDKTTVIGKGWTSVFVARMGDGSQPSAGSATSGNDPTANAAQGFLNSLPRSGNGRVLTSKLFTVMLTDDGRLLVGAVSPERLAQVAADPAAQLK